MKRTTWLFAALLAFSAILSSCGGKGEKTQVDLILMNGTFYTVDSSFSKVNAVAIHDGKFVAVGDIDDITDSYTTNHLVDLKGAFITPGLFDAHCHLYGYGLNKDILDLKGTWSLQNILDKVSTFAMGKAEGWIIGRGWNEEEWTEKSNVNNLKLSMLFPDIPVVLHRVDGHSALVNQAALELAGIDASTRVEGGEIELFNGMPTGVLKDKAVNLVTSLMPEPTYNQKVKAILDAQEDCLRNGLTSVVDAGHDDQGLSLEIIQIIDSLQKTGDLKIRVYAMARTGAEDFEFFEKNGPILSDRLIVRSFKIYADGALGSRGALLLEPYCDDSSTYGLQQAPIGYYDSIYRKIMRLQMQACTHAIGDSANRFVLSLYAKYNLPGNDQRWRIEHAQVVHPDDWNLFGKHNIIPSVQPTHLITDMIMARKRLCTDERLRGAYAYLSLYKAAGHIAFGTDFPVEGVSPVGTFIAAVYGQREDGSRLHPNELFSPEKALFAMTLDAAYSCFLEQELGSIEVGKKADLTIFENNLLTAGPRDKVKVTSTFVNGQIVYLR